MESVIGLFNQEPSRVCDTVEHLQRLCLSLPLMVVARLKVKNLARQRLELGQ